MNEWEPSLEGRMWKQVEYWKQTIYKLLKCSAEEWMMKEERYEEEEEEGQGEGGAGGGEEK